MESQRTKIKDDSDSDVSTTEERMRKEITELSSTTSEIFKKARLVKRKNDKHEGLRKQLEEAKRDKELALEDLEDARSLIVTSINTN